MLAEEGLDIPGRGIAQTRAQLPVVHVLEQRVVRIDFAGAVVQLGDVAALEGFPGFKEKLVVRRRQNGAGYEQQDGKNVSHRFSRQSGPANGGSFNARL